MLGTATLVAGRDTKARMPALDVKYLLDAPRRTLDPRRNSDPQRPPNRRWPVVRRINLGFALGPGDEILKTVTGKQKGPAATALVDRAKEAFWRWRQPA